MGLTTTLGNALSGLNVTQSNLDVLSRNVSNSGTPGYHRQSVTALDQTGNNSSYAISTSVTRAFDQSLQTYYTTETSDSSYSSVQASYLNQLQTYLGKPGDNGSLDTVFGNFQSALSALTASPDDYSARATAVNTAQSLSATLNQLTGAVQGLRQQANGQIQTDVDSVNQALTSLAGINGKLSDQNLDATSRAALLDQRDVMVAKVAGIIDVKTTYRQDGSVALATRSGVGLLDQQPSLLEFQPITNIGATSQFSTTDAQNGVGTLTLRTPSGLTLDLVKQNVLQSGELAGLVNLRDNTLVQAQGQLDQVAAGLAQAFSTVTTAGTATGTTPTAGLAADLSTVRPGNDVLLNYTEGGAAKTVRVVRVEDGSKLPMDFVDAGGTRVIGTSFAGGAAGVASVLQAALGPGLQISGVGSTLTGLSNGTAGNAVNSLATRTTSTATQDAGLGVSLFVDAGNSDYTGDLSGKGQQLGFAGRIGINAAILADNTKLVQATAAGSTGDVTRVNYLYDQLNGMTFAGAPGGKAGLGGALNGTVSDLISQTLDYQGSSTAAAQADNSSHTDAMSALTSRMTDEYGVNVNDEMARLVQLQAAYSANARVVTVVQNLLNSLMAAMGP
jgi:flagellar hook-associated protein 1 FlgK